MCQHIFTISYLKSSRFVIKQLLIITNIPIHIIIISRDLFFHVAELYESDLRDSRAAADPWTTAHQVSKKSLNSEDNVYFSSSCRIFKTKDDITIKISDRGGGMSRRVRRKIFNYMYSTAPKVIFLQTMNIVFEVRFLGGVAYFWRFIWRGFGGRSPSYAWAWIWSAPVEALCKVLLISM